MQPVDEERDPSKRRSREITGKGRMSTSPENRLRSYTELKAMDSRDSDLDSRKTRRKWFDIVTCCIHGNPCSIGIRNERLRRSGLLPSRETTSTQMSTERSRTTSYETACEPIDDTLSFGYNRDVERASLDVPLTGWNRERSNSLSSSAFTYENVHENLDAIDDQRYLREPYRFLRRDTSVEKIPLSKTVEIKSYNPSTSSKTLSSETSFKPEANYEIVDAAARTASEELLRTARSEPVASQSTAWDMYIGIHDFETAEKAVIKPTTFKLYHCLPSNKSLYDIPPAITLHIIYRSGNGKAYHYPILEHKERSHKKILGPVNTYQVDYGNPLAPKFLSLDSLVRFYSVYVHVHQDDNDEIITDLFPVDRINRYPPYIEIEKK